MRGIGWCHPSPLFSANNFALKNKRKTLSAGDVFSALQDMEFEEFIPELKDCLEGKKPYIPCLKCNVDGICC